MKGTILQACVPTGAQVESNEGFFGLELLARVAEASGQPLGSVGVKRKGKVSKIKSFGGLGEETRKSLEFALTRLKDCQEKLGLVQGRLASDLGREFLVTWNETDGHYQLGLENKMDRIYTINIWIRGIWDSQVDAPVRKESDEEFQVSLMSGRDQILSSCSVRIAGLNSPAGLRASFKSSAGKFYNFLESSCIKMTHSKSEERQVGFLELPDRIATSSEIEFSILSQTDVKEHELSQNFKLNVLMYLELSSHGTKQGVLPEEMLRRKFELSLGDQNLLPFCWSLKKKQERNQVIELSPKSSERPNSIPLDLTLRSHTANCSKLTGNMEADEITQLRSVNYAPNNKLEASIELLGTDSESRTEAHQQKLVALCDSGLKTDHHSNERWSPDINPKMKDAKNCQEDVLQADRSSPSKLSEVSPLEPPTLRKPPTSKRHKRLSELELMIAALDKNLAELEEQKKPLKKP